MYSVTPDREVLQRHYEILQLRLSETELPHAMFMPEGLIIANTNRFEQMSKGDLFRVNAGERYHVKMAKPDPWWKKWDGTILLALGVAAGLLCLF